MDIYASKGFSKWAKDEGISDEDLCTTITDMKGGLLGDSLGGNLYKKRIGREGSGKSSGYRTLIGCKIGERAFFLYGFPKKSRANIKPNEKAALKALAKLMLGMSDEKLKKALDNGEYLKIN